MRVRVLASSATDVRGVQMLAARHAVACEVEILGMGSEAERERFRELKQAHDWRHLPMVFVDDRFVGGERELRDALRGVTPPNDPAGEIARWLGFGGLAPFAALALLTLFGWRPFGIDAFGWLMAYAATILSFVGAVHWGIVIGQPTVAEQRGLLLGSVVPALLAWLALLLTPATGVKLMLASFVGWYGWERLHAWHLYPAWYRALRGQLTIGASVALLIGALAN